MCFHILSENYAMSGFDVIFNFKQAWRDDFNFEIKGTFPWDIQVQMSTGLLVLAQNRNLC
jgi:hypothetical protein